MNIRWLVAAATMVFGWTTMIGATAVQPKADISRWRFRKEGHGA